jgi:retinol dehydrogenase-12
MLAEGTLLLSAFSIGIVVVSAVILSTSEFRNIVRVTLLGSHNIAARPGASAFDPARDIPSLAGKVILITGAAGDLGRQTATELARHGRPARIYVADLPRDEKAKKAITDQITDDAYRDAGPKLKTGAVIRTDIRYLELDLGSFDSVRKCASIFNDLEPRLDILFLNAGLIRASPMMTTDGYELHFGVNYLGHALLAQLLMPVLIRTTQQQADSDVRVIILSSEGHIAAPKNGIDLTKVQTNCADMHYSTRYGQSKVAQIVLMKDLARRYPQIKTVAIHPGRILTSMAMKLKKESISVRIAIPILSLICVPVNVGIRNHLWAATSPDVVNGTYYEPVGVPGSLSPAAEDVGLLETLHEWTENALSAVKPLD